MISPFKDSTVLDIGAGTGAWAILLSKFVKKVTAIEPSVEMRSILEDNLDEAFDRMRCRFGVYEDSEQDKQLRILLKEHIYESEGQIQWPSEVRTGLVYWNT